MRAVSRQDQRRELELAGSVTPRWGLSSALLHCLRQPAGRQNPKARLGEALVLLRRRIKGLGQVDLTEARYWLSERGQRWVQPIQLKKASLARRKEAQRRGCLNPEEVAVVFRKGKLCLHYFVN